MIAGNSFRFPFRRRFLNFAHGENRGDKETDFFMEIQSVKVPKGKVAEFYSALGELHAYERKPVLGKCMFWSANCKAAPIGSHLLSRSWLEQVADRSHHVVQFRLTTEDRVNKPGRLKAHRVGINEATTFPGFCEQHDNELFAYLEK
jgi:hypothetical protein